MRCGSERKVRRLAHLSSRPLGTAKRLLGWKQWKSYKTLDARTSSTREKNNPVHDQKDGRRPSTKTKTNEPACTASLPVADLSRCDGRREGDYHPLHWNWIRRLLPRYLLSGRKGGEYRRRLAEKGYPRQSAWGCSSPQDTTTIVVKKRETGMSDGEVGGGKKFKITSNKTSKTPTQQEMDEVSVCGDSEKTSSDGR